jgi:hypothetical protein
MGILWLLYACSDQNSKKKNSIDTLPVNTIQQPKKVSDIEARLFKADSVQVIFYDNPDGDSLRYTRYFTYAETTDTAKINTLLQELNQVFVQQPTTRNCRSEGKIFLLNGEDILKTIYFSTRQDSCSYFYFIKDGNFIYLPITETAGQLVKDLKKSAKKPTNKAE